jgi:hypothetical protein
MSKHTKTHRRPAAVATVTLLGGITASLAGNLQAINLGSHTPGIGAYISATIWPLTLLAVVEVLIHTPWMRNWRDGLTKAVAVSLVGAMAAYISYFHLAHTLSAYGYDVASRYAGPLAIDAAMVMATLALNRVGHARRAALAPPVQVASVQPAPVQYVATEADVAESEAAFRGEGIPSYEDVATEAQSYLDRLSTELASEVAPVSAVPVSPAPSNNAVKAESVPDEAVSYLSAWLIARQDGQDAPRPGEVDALLAGHFGITPRTVRRWRTALVPNVQ